MEALAGTVALFFTVFWNEGTPIGPTPPLAPPVAARQPKTTEIHGKTLTDDYFWLREKTNPDVIAYLKAENEYTESVMKPTVSLQENLYKEMLGRIKETDINVPYKEGEHFYYSRTEQGQQYPIYCRKKGSLRAREQVLLDLNEVGKDQKFTALGAYEVSDDGAYLAYSMDFTGFREYKLYIKDLKSGRTLPDDIGKVAFVFWAGDRDTLFYATEDDAKRPFRIYRHRLGDPKEKDTLVYEEKDALYRAFAYRSRSKDYIFIGSVSSTTTEFHYLRAQAPSAPLTLFFARKEGVEYYPDHHSDRFYLRINDRGKNFRLVTVPLADPTIEKATEVVPHRQDTMLEDFDIFKDWLVCSERTLGLPRIRITELATGQTHYLNFPEPTYTASVSTNKEFDTQKLRYTYQSLVSPASIYDYDMRKKKRQLKKRQEIPSGYNPKAYQSERIEATASDGVKIPLSIVYKKGFVKDGNAPLHLIGYGSYGFPYPVTFSTNRLSLLDRGFAIAIAHIRGGGEMGKEWHDQGKLLSKKNTFTDFIACAEHLIAEKYTSSSKLTIQGGSAGGLLMGAVVNLRPDLFRAVISDVPFVDVINTMLDASLPLTIGEYLEWGNPDERSAFEYIYSYSPYDNLQAREYPAMLVTTSLNDSQVMYWEPAKYVAKLRTLKRDKSVLLLKTNMDAGHGGASGRYDALKEIAFDYAFLLHQLGIEK